MPSRPCVCECLPKRIIEHAYLNLGQLVPVPLQCVHRVDAVFSQMCKQGHIVHAHVVGAVAVIA